MDIAVSAPGEQAAMVNVASMIPALILRLTALVIGRNRSGCSDAKTLRTD